MNNRTPILLLLLGTLLLFSFAPVTGGGSLTGKGGVISYCDNDGLVACVLARCEKVEESQLSLFEVERELAGSPVPRNLVLSCYSLQDMPRKLLPCGEYFPDLSYTGACSLVEGGRYLVFVLASKNRLWSPGLTSESAIFPADWELISAAELGLKDRHKPFLPPLVQLKREHFFDEHVFVAREDLSPGSLEASKVQLQYFPRAKLPRLPFLPAESKPSDFVLVTKVKKGEYLTVMDVRRVTNSGESLKPIVGTTGLVRQPGGMMRAEALAYIKDGRPELALKALAASLPLPARAVSTASPLKAMALAQLGRDAEAYKTLALEFKCSSMFEEVWAEAVFDYLRRRLGETKAYELSYEELLVRAPADASIYAGLAEKRFQSGRLPEALKAIDQAVLFDSGSAHYRELRSRILRSLGGKANMARAREDALYVLQKEPRYGQDGHGHRYRIDDPEAVWRQEKD